jgi:drug/metabolite transporter (DMT)-like permease
MGKENPVLADQIARARVLGKPATIVLTAVTMLAFAANSVLCRSALARTSIDPASFTFARIVSGAIMLWVIVAVSGRGRSGGGSWRAGLALFGYAAGFSFAYVTLSAGTGALLLFGAVQATMVIAGIVRGEHLTPVQWLGLALALAGLLALLAPGVSAPPVLGAVLMLGAGVAWGVYSLLGRQSMDPLGATAGNFLRAVPLGVLLAALMATRLTPDPMGLVYATASGALASALGYTMWYTALRGLTAAQGAAVQLSVPMITAVGGVIALGETITWRLTGASAAILGGIALVILRRFRRF